MSDYLTEKNRLADYLRSKNIQFDQSKKTWRCPNHDDQKPSAVLYENNDGHVLWCPVCQESWNIFAVCSMLENIPNNKEHFGELLKYVRNTLNILHEEKSKPESKIKYNPFPEDETEKQKINAQIKKLSDKKGEIKGSWKYKNKSGETIALDVRFERAGERKEIITFWFSEKLEWTKPPVFIYGLNFIDYEKPTIIHEGAKCADIGRENLPEFNHVSWSGGSGKAGQADWSFLKNQETYIMRDNDEPGLKAAKNIQKQLTHAKIINPPTDKKGDDIEQFLEIMSPAEITSYILSVKNSDGEPSKPTNDTQSSDGAPPPERPVDGSSTESLTYNRPYRILGIGDDGKANFISSAERFYKWDLESLSKTKLMLLCDKLHWQDEFPKGKDSISWDDAINEVMRLSEIKDHDDSNIRGRGAWRDGKKISYHDGKKTYGEHDYDKIYLRLNRVYAGLDHEPADKELRKKIKDIVLNLSFETPADAVRCLAWSSIAAFGGALEYRPAMLLTGNSGSGKTEVQNRIMKPLSMGEWFDTGSTTTAGLRGKIGKNSIPVILDEAGKTTEKAKFNFEEILNYMRSNYSADSPDGTKGTKDGGYISYKMNSMFAFASTDPTIEDVQDENRILRINFVKKDMESEVWTEYKNQLEELLSKENCYKIRSYVWSQLSNIMKLTDKIVTVARDKTKRDHRASYAEMQLASCFMVVWSGEENPSDEQIERMLNKYYQYQPADEHRNEAEEFVQSLLEKQIDVYYEHSRERLTIQECYHRLKTKSTPANDYLPEDMEKALILSLSRHGFINSDDNIIGIRNNHDFIKKVTHLSSGYSKILKRHPGYIKNDEVLYFVDGGRGHKCTTLRVEMNLKKYSEIKNDPFGINDDPMIDFE